MDAEAPARERKSSAQGLEEAQQKNGTPGEQARGGEVGPAHAKDAVTNQSTGWRVPLVLTLCLLQAADVLKGARRVSGEVGGAVVIQCHYTPSSVNRHQRKYWCHLCPPAWICQTIVSTNHYTHHKYLGRVALADFPFGGWFEVRLSRLALDDMGHYRCGIGNGNNLLFLSVHLIVSAATLLLTNMKTRAAEFPEPVHPAFPEEESSSWILTLGSTTLALFLLVALVLLQRKIWRRTSQEANRAPRIALIQMTRLLEVNTPTKTTPPCARERTTW
ncbi:high affinity immunoglobulin alpha and immunoglobulin mu Fc receptor [Thomomys bottae]